MLISHLCHFFIQKVISYFLIQQHDREPKKEKTRVSPSHYLLDYLCYMPSIGVDLSDQNNVQHWQSKIV